MGSRSRMIHRLYIQRNTASVDVYGHLSPPVWTALSTVPGYVWIEKDKLSHKDELSQVSVQYQGIVPLGTDIAKSDRIEKVENRIAVKLFDILIIDDVIRRKDHLELTLRRHV